MSSGLKLLFCASVSACALLPSGLALAATMGSLAPHDPPANGQAIEQWVADPRTKCVATDPSYIPDDSISWQGSCRKDGVIFGAGTLTFLNNGQVVETITGTFADGFVRVGTVSATWSDGTKYQGNQLDGMFHGMGKFVSSKGRTLDGEWKMGAFLTGKASVVWPNGDRYDGDWKNGKPDGTGVEVWADGRRYEGQWRDGVPVGDVQTSGTEGGSTAAAAPVAPDTTASAIAQPPAQSTATAPQSLAKVASLVASPASATVAAANVTKSAAVENSGNATPNPALPLRSVLGSQLAAVDGASLELGLTEEGFERTLVLPNGNSQALQFTFANGSVGTVADGKKAVGVFRARPDEIDIDYADGTTETISEGDGGGLVDRAHSVDGHAMCTAWYPQEHVFSQSEKQAAVQEYASRLGVTVSSPSKKQRAHDVGPACGGAFVASGSQKAAGTDESDAAKTGSSPPRPTIEHAQLDGHVLDQSKPSAENAPVAVPSSAVHLVDAPNAPAVAPPRLEKASFTPDQPIQGSNGIRATAAVVPQPGASDCLSVESNGEYWGFQNSCSKSVQFAYCEMSGDNPLISCKRTAVVGSVAANSFSALVSDRSLTEKNVNHEFRWMACDGGAGEVVPHLDKVDPPSGRCERAVATAE